jgi:hypothetical protein
MEKTLPRDGHLPPMAPVSIKKYVFSLSLFTGTTKLGP